MVRRPGPRPGGRRAGRGTAAGEPAPRRYDARAPRVPKPAERNDEASGLEQHRRLPCRAPRRRHPGNEGVLAGWRCVYFEDPDGYPLELVEVAYYNADERRDAIAEYLSSRS